MSKLRVEGFTISLDGFGAGPNQDINNPLGVGGTSLHAWALPTLTLLGSGERLFEGVNLPALGYACTRNEATARATHLILSRQ